MLLVAIAVLDRCAASVNCTIWALIVGGTHRHEPEVGIVFGADAVEDLVDDRKKRSPVAPSPG